MAGPAPRRRDPRRRLDRRAVLGAVASLALLAGCSEVTRYEFAAPPVVLPPAARQRLGYTEAARESVVGRRRRDVGGVELTATIESQLAVYRASDASGSPDPGRPTVGVLSTPRATVQGRSLNPLATRSPAKLRAPLRTFGSLTRSLEVR